jgi:hypothetical protein
MVYEHVTFLSPEESSDEYEVICNNKSKMQTKYY